MASPRSAAALAPAASLLLVLAAAALPAPAAAAPVAHARSGSTPRLVADLSGRRAVPPAGNASGRVVVRLKASTGEVCWRIKLRRKARSGVLGLHIHDGRVGRNGPVVIGLATGDADLQPLYQGREARGCVDGIDASAIRAVLRQPRRYYVALHDQRAPEGVARGQLRRD